MVPYAPSYNDATPAQNARSEGWLCFVLERCKQRCSRHPGPLSPGPTGRRFFGAALAKTVTIPGPSPGHLLWVLAKSVRSPGGISRERVVFRVPELASGGDAWMRLCDSRKCRTIRESYGSGDAMQTLTDKMLSRIYGKKRGWVFTPAHFLDLGNDLAVRKTLQVLCDRGQIRRLAPGLFDYPREHPQLGKLQPTPEQIAQALAYKDSSRIQPSGAYAANLLGLSEQVPAKVIFQTDATDRRIIVGRQEIILKRTTPKNMATAGRISGLVIQALRYLGKEHVDNAVIGQLAQRLSPEERRQLMKDIRYAPAWIGEIFRHLADEDK